MAIFSFVRDGVSYKVSGPPGATESQALAVLEAQLISGTLVGQSPGTTIDLAAQVANGLNLVGVQLEDTTVTAVDQLPASLPVDFVEGSDIAAQLPGDPIGSMNSEQVRGLLAQRAKSVNQALDAISAEKGIGKYGLSLEQLERSGYIKPGTSQLLSTGVDINSILKNPGSWTGKDNVANLEGFTSSSAVQQAAQQTVLTQAFNSLNQQGLLPRNLSPEDLGAVLNTASTFNVQTAADWLQGQLPTEVQATINAVARAGQYATQASTVATLVGAGSFSSALLVAGGALGIEGSAIDSGVQALAVFEKIYNSNTPVGRSLQASFGSFGSKIGESLGLGSDTSNLINRVLAEPGQIVTEVVNRIGNIGVNIGGEISQAIQSLGGASGLGNLSSAVGAGDIFDGFGSLASDVFGGDSGISTAFDLTGIGGAGSGIFDVTRVDALGNEFTINLFTELKLEAATLLDTVGSQLFGVQNLGNSLFGNFAALGDIVPVVGTAIQVFNTFFGGGDGDSSGLNFNLDGQTRPVGSFQNTVNRSTLDAAVTRIIGDPRVTNIAFGVVNSRIQSPIRIDTTGIATVKNLIGTVTASAANLAAKQTFS